MVLLHVGPGLTNSITGLANAALDSIPIVALTADVLDAGRQACQDAGMDGFLSKPISPKELDKMIARLFPEPAREAAE